MGSGSAGRQKVLINWTNGDANEVRDYPAPAFVNEAHSPDADTPTAASQTYIPPSISHKSIPCAISSGGITPTASASGGHLQPAGPQTRQNLIQVSRPQPTSSDKPAHISLRFKLSGTTRPGRLRHRQGRSEPLAARTQEKDK